MKKLIALFSAVLLMLGSLPVFALSSVASGERDELIPIHEVYIEGLHAAVAGETPETSSTLYIVEGNGYFLIYQYWHDNTLGQDMFNEQVPFQLSHQYSQGCLIGADDGYYIADDCVYYFNGDASLADMSSLMPHPYFDGCYFIQSIGLQCVDPQAMLPGDVDMNGAVDTADALLALRCALGLAELDEAQLAAADVNGNGSCDSTDALLILRFSLGLIENF